MKYLNQIILSAVILLTACTTKTTKDIESKITDNTKYVNTFIGTGGHGHTFPGATTPYGMVQLLTQRQYN